MPLHLSISISDAFDVVIGGIDPPAPGAAVERTEPFPRGGTDLLLLNVSGVMRTGGQRQRLAFASCLATVRRSDPFLFRNDATVAFPPQIRQPDDGDEILRRDDLGNIPGGLFIAGRETIWLELLDLDARGLVDGSPGRLVLGETLRREHPDLHERALGVLQSSLGAGFPARCALALPAVLITPRGTFKLGPDSFATAEVSGLADAAGFRLTGRVDLFRVEELRRNRDGACEPSGQLISLDLGRIGGAMDGYQAFATLKRRLLGA